MVVLIEMIINCVTRSVVVNGCLMVVDRKFLLVSPISFHIYLQSTSMFHCTYMKLYIYLIKIN